MTYNVPRVPEVGDQREPIWAKRSVAGYSLLSAGAGAGLCNSKKLRHGCSLIKAHPVSYPARVCIYTPGGSPW